MHDRARSSDRDTLLESAIANVREIMTTVIEHDATHRALVIYDTEHELTRILTDAYRVVLPDAQYVDFHTRTKEDILSLFESLSPRDLVVLIQSGDFRLNEFRIRIQLFQRKLKVIDHGHLFRNTPDSWMTYIDALAYDTDWYRGVGSRLKEKLTTVDTLRIHGDGTELVVTGGLEIPKPNLGDYTGMTNIGGTFPIGEVFTEAKTLSAVNGSLMIHAYADTDFTIAFHDPFRIDITDGLVVGWDTNAPSSFSNIIAMIQAHERPIIREIGFGMNRAITQERSLRDITAYERCLGLHVSCGEKHTVYKKEGIAADKTRYHVDLFPAVSRVEADNEVIFDHDTYCV